MRILNTNAIDALSGDAVDLVMLIDMDFAGGRVRLNTSRSDIEDLDSPPAVYLGTGVIGVFEQFEEKTREVTGVSFTISGIPTEIISIALNEQVRGRPIAFYLAILDATSKAVLDISSVWSGVMSTMSINMNDGTASIKLTAESRGVVFGKPRPLRYTDADQQKLFPGDRCLEFIVKQSQENVVWPAASFWRQ